MGYMRHHAIVVSGLLRESLYIDYRPPRIDDAHKKALEVFPRVSGIVASNVNGYGSFLIPPDGSKLGWEASEAGAARRAVFIEWLRSMAYEDGSSPFQWVEVQYGDDNRETKVAERSD